jgi:hypothetical protein
MMLRHEQLHGPLIKPGDSFNRRPRQSINDDLPVDAVDAALRFEEPKLRRRRLQY